MNGAPTADEVIATLERWEAHGARWRIQILTEKLTIVELCTCHGEAVDEIRSNDPALLHYLWQRAG